MFIVYFTSTESKFRAPTVLLHRRALALIFRHASHSPRTQHINQPSRSRSPLPSQTLTTTLLACRILHLAHPRPGAIPRRALPPRQRLNQRNTPTHAFSERARVLSRAFSSTRASHGPERARTSAILMIRTPRLPSTHSHQPYLQRPPADCQNVWGWYIDVFHPQ